MNKPKKITQDNWNQHKTWMGLMMEGSATGIKKTRDKKALSRR